MNNLSFKEIATIITHCEIANTKLSKENKFLAQLGTTAHWLHERYSRFDSQKILRFDTLIILFHSASGERGGPKV